MIERFNEYSDFLDKITGKIQVLKTEQLVRALVNYYEGMNTELAFQIIKAYQRNRHIFLTEGDLDGWAIKPNLFRIITHDKFYAQENPKNSNNRIPSIWNVYNEDCSKILMKKPPEELLTQSQKNDVNSFWIILDMLPESEDFQISKKPWTYVFTTDADEETNRSSLLYQIIKINKINQDAVVEMLKNVPESEEKDADMKKVYRRIALVEDERVAHRLPHIGFSHVCKLNDDKPRHYEVIKKIPATERWT